MAASQATSTRDPRIGSVNPARTAVFSVSYRIMFASLVTYTVIGAALVGIYSARLMNNSWENILPEGAHVYAAIRTARTGRLYSPYTQSPYVVQSYGPLFYTINASIAWASHLDVRQMVLHSRMICFLSYLLCGLLVFAISRKTGASLSLSVLAALMMLGHPDFLLWNVSVRPDMPFLLVMLVSLYFAVRAGARGWPCLVTSGCFAGLAFLIKQPGIAVVIAVFAVLAWKKEYRKAIVFAVSAGVPVMVMFALLLWREPSFLAQFTSVGKASWSLREGFHYFIGRFATDYNAVVRLVPLCIGILGFAQAAKQEQGRQMIAWFALINLVVGVSGLPQLGSAYNYFLPGWAGCALLLPAAVESVWQHSRLPASMLMASAFLLWATWVGSLTCRNSFAEIKAPKNTSYSALRPYRIISDRSLLSLYGHDPDLVDNAAVHSLELQGYWTSAPVVENIRHKEYDLVLLLRVNYKHVVPYFRGVSEYAPSVVAALNENYIVLCSTMGSIVLKPRDREIALTADDFGQMFHARCGTGLADKPPGLSVKEGMR